MFLWLILYTQPSFGRDDLMAFVTGGTADYKKTDAVAEMAIKWAQERRQKIEVRCFAYIIYCSGDTCNYEHKIVSRFSFIALKCILFFTCNKLSFFSLRQALLFAYHYHVEPNTIICQ